MVTGNSPGIETDYTYNDNQQLTSTQIAGGGSAGLTNFSYDDNGNMEQSDNNGDATDYSFNLTGKISSVDFDNGMAYDYQYDSLGNRIQSIEDDGVTPPITTDYYFDSLLSGAMSGPVLENVSDNTARFNLRADNVQLVTQTYSADVTAGVTPFAGADINTGLTDGFGNMVELANIDTGVTAWQTNVTAFGESIGQTDPAGIGNQTGYLGRPQLTTQASGLIDMNARSYDPSLGRFISPDPIQGDTGSPQSMNPYAYGLNNSYATPDPSGLMAVPNPWEGLSNLFNQVDETVSSSAYYAGAYIIGEACDIYDPCEYYVSTKQKDNFDWLNYSFIVGTAGLQHSLDIGIGKKARSKFLSDLLRIEHISYGKIPSIKNSRLVSFAKNKLSKGIIPLAFYLDLKSELSKDQSTNRAIARALVLNAGSMGGAAAGTAACGTETIASSGVGVVACPSLVIGGGLLFRSLAGNRFDSAWSEK